MGGAAVCTIVLMVGAVREIGFAMGLGIVGLLIFLLVFAAGRMTAKGD